MLLTDARRPARTAPDGTLIPMAEQDRRQWNRDQIAEGVELLERTLPRRVPGLYQIQAAIAARHDEAPSVTETDWPQILALYNALVEFDHGPVVALNRVVAVAMVHGPMTGLSLLSTLDSQGKLPNDHRLLSVRGHLLELAEDRDGAAAAYRAAAERTASLPQQRYLHARAARLIGPGATTYGACRPRAR